MKALPLLVSDSACSVSAGPRNLLNIGNSSASAGLVKTFSIFLLSAACAFAQVPVPLGAAATFGVLAGSGVTNTAGPTVIAGNVGVSPGSAINGFPPGTVIDGSIEPGNVAMAHADLILAYDNAMTQLPVTANLTTLNLGGRTLRPGIYAFDTSAMLNGTLTLNGGGVYIFQIGSTLTTATGAAVVAINGADAANVFWQVGSSATLGTGTRFIGNILANISITNDVGGTMAGRMLAINGAVTLADEVLTYPPATTPGGFGGPPLPSATPAPSSWTLVLIGLVCVMIYQTRERWLRRLKNI
jgi:hypothetical protein